VFATIAAGLAVAVLPAAALAASPAKVQIEPAEQTPTGFKLNAKVNPEGSATTYYFIYKQAGEVECEDLEGCGPETPHGGPLNGDTQQEVQAEVTGLTPGPNYVYWLIARNAFSEDVRSASLGFTTPPPPPSIEGESVSHVTSTDATLEAQIDVEGLKHGADYQFQIVQSPSEYASELICPSTRPQGHEICVGPQSPGAAPIGFVPSDEAGPLKSSEVSLDLAGAGITLKPGTTYHYRVIAARAVQTEDTIQWEGPTVYGADQTFTTPSAGTAPVIDSVSISHLTPTDATLEAQINTEGLTTSYQFGLWTICGGTTGGSQCQEVNSYFLPTGLLLGSFEDQSVSLDLNSAGVTLQPGGTYHYSVSATSKAGTTETQTQKFTTPEPVSPGAQPQGSAAPSTTGGGNQAGTSNNTTSTGSGASLPSGVTPAGSPLRCLCDCALTCHPKNVSAKLAKALKQCKKDKSKSKRTACEKRAKKSSRR
jgi:hypothetical protein